MVSLFRRLKERRQQPGQQRKVRLMHGFSSANTKMSLCLYKWIKRNVNVKEKDRKRKDGGWLCCRKNDIKGRQGVSEGMYNIQKWSLEKCWLEFPVTIFWLLYFPLPHTLFCHGSDSISSTNTYSRVLPFILISSLSSLSSLYSDWFTRKFVTISNFDEFSYRQHWMVLQVKLCSLGDSYQIN